MPRTEIWTALFISFSLLLYLYIGWRSKVKNANEFFVAGQSIPALANGAATAGDWISAASFISMAGLVSFLGYDGSIYLIGWSGGYVLIALLIAPYLRKFGQYTVPDFIGARYYSKTARLVAVIAAVFICLVYIVGQMRGVGIIFSRFLQVDVNTGVIIGMILVGFFSILGGMRGITWTQMTQYGVFCLAFIIPAIALSHQLTGTPVPQLAFTTSDIISQLNDIHRELGFAAYTEPFGSKSPLDMGLVVFTLMTGTAGLPHIIVRFYTVKTMRAARYSAGWALVFIIIFYTTAPVIASFARYSLIDSLSQQPVEVVQQIDWVNKWEKTDLLVIEDKNGNGLVELTPDEATNEIMMDADAVVLSLPEVAALPAWITGLVAAGGLAAALSTAAGLLLVISSAIAHDVYYRMFNSNASESEQVMVGRMMVGLALVVSAYLGVHPPGFVAEVVAFAFGLAAATFFPAITLGIFDQRTNRNGAVSGMLAGIIFTTGYVVGAKFYGMPLWFFNISPEGIGGVGLVLNCMITVGVSRVTEPPPIEVQQFVQNLRSPGDEPPQTVDLYYSLEERLEYRNVQLKDLNQQLETQVQEKQQAEAALTTLNQELESRVEKRTIELQQAIKDLQSTQLQLVQHEKMSTLGNLVAGVAHEINNPVGFLMGNIKPAKAYVEDLLQLIDLFLEKMPKPGTEITDPEITELIEEIDLDFVREDLPQLIESMSLGVNRIKGISTSLRNFSRKDQEYKTEGDIHEGLDSTLLILKHRIKASDKRPAIEIVKHYGKLPKIQCFPGQLNQVFMNILANAIDAFDEANQGKTFKEIEIAPNQITIKTAATDDAVFIHIRDNGMGMSASVSDHIFDHLYTTKAVGKGTGLGLAIAQQIIVEKHSGTITVESTLAIGTEFVIELPA